MLRYVLHLTVLAAVIGLGCWSVFPCRAEEPTILQGSFTIPFKAELVGQHPRLLFSVEQMQQWWRTPRDDQQFIWDAGDAYFRFCRGPAPAGEPWNEGDGWQRFGWWRGTTTAFLYAKTGDERYARSAIDLMMAMCRSEHWELGGEQDYGMGAGNIMATVAIIYDITYDLLSEAQRQTVRQRLLLAADRFYHYGFNSYKTLDKPAVRYWQSDPQNNHRWHRVCGYLLGTLAIYGEQPGVEGYLDHAIDEAEFILTWLPQDGSCHESVGYQAFGTQFLVPAIVALDRVTGSNHLTTNRGFREFPHFRAHMVTPDRKHVWSFGDGGESTYYFSHYNFKLAAAWGDAFMQAAHTANFKASPGSYGYHGFSLIWHDPALASADLADYPTHRYFPDVEIATFRAGWTDPDALAAFFKCGPYGGHRLNEYRDSFATAHYVNVAHDHPDANSFLLAWRGELFAQDFGTKDRRTVEHNTIVVNGKGQAGSGLGWTQPIDNMGKRARIEQYFGAAGYGLVRGEAGGFYDDLSRYGRTLLYVDDAYVVAVDDIRATKPSTIDWVYNSTGAFSSIGEHQWKITRGGEAVVVSLAGPEALVSKAGPNARGSALRATASDVRQTGMVALVAPQDDAPARLVDCRVDGPRVRAKVQRGDRTDLIVLGGDPATAYESLRTDAEAAVVTLAGGAPVKMLLVGGRFVRFGALRIQFTHPVNALIDLTSGEVEVCSPLGRGAFRTSLMTDGVTVAAINGRPAGEPSGGKYTVESPTWQTRQDEKDGFAHLRASALKAK